MKATPYQFPDPENISTRFESLIEKLQRNERADPASIVLRGEHLNKPIFWQGRQWAVTAHGLERLDGTYEIKADRLWDNEHLGGWILQVGLKTTVDLEDFMVALCVARVKFKEQFIVKEAN